MPTLTSAELQLRLEMPADFREVRLLMAARRPRQAASLLRDRLGSIKPGPERKIAEWYLGLAEHAAGNVQHAPHTRIVLALPFDYDDKKYFELLSRASEDKALALPWWILLCPPTAAVLAVEPSAGSAIEEVAAFVNRAREECTDEPSIKNQIRLSTWSLLFAELITEAPQLGLWSHAVDAFEEGNDTLAQIDARIDQDPSLEAQIASTPELAMRLDAARVRQPETERRQQLARAQERQRLEQLRRIVRAYRDATKEFALFNVYSLVGNPQAAQASTLVAMKNLASVGQITAERNDAHLFDDEPRLNETAKLSMRMPAPEPFSAETISLIKGLQSLTNYNLAIPLSGELDVDLLHQARLWAQAAVGEKTDLELPDSPPGSDPSSPLGHYAMALACEGLGRAKLMHSAADVAARKDAEKDFSEARTHFARALEFLAANQQKNAATTDFVGKVQTAKERLQGPDVFLLAADRLIQQGQPKAAWKVLGEALERNGGASVWLARAEHGRRARANCEDVLNELDEAVRAGIVDGADAVTLLARSKIVLDQVWHRLVEENPGPRETTDLESAIATATAGLRGARAKSPDDAAIRAQLDAYLGLALAYHSILTDNAAVAEGYRLARDASAALDILLRNEGSPTAQLPLREALVASRLAQGHLSLSILPDYRDEPLLAFSAAFDEAAKLPFSQPDVKALGSPLLAALSRRPSEAGTMLAREERHRRELMTRFVEAAFSLEFGAPDAAADQMARALEDADSKRPGEPAMPEAARLLAEADGFDAQLALRESMQAFKALASVAAGHADTATVEMLRVIVPDAVINDLDDVDAGLVNGAVSRIQSPLMSYALAFALESTLDSFSPRETQRVAVRSRQALAAQEHTADLLKSLHLFARYPHLVELTKQMGQRLSLASYFVDRAATLRRRGDLDGAMHELMRGLRRHPASADLWQSYAQSQLDRLKREKQTVGFDDLLAEIDAAASAGLLPEFQRQMIRGAVHEARQEEGPALAAYLIATRTAADSKQRIFARSKAASLRARLAMAQ